MPSQGDQSMNCAKLDDCPRARCVGCNGTDCDKFISPEHYELLKKADTAFFRGFVLGAAFLMIVVAIIVWTKGV